MGWWTIPDPSKVTKACSLNHHVGGSDHLSLMESYHITRPKMFLITCKKLFQHDLVPAANYFRWRTIQFHYAASKCKPTKYPPKEELPPAEVESAAATGDFDCAPCVQSVAWCVDKTMVEPVFAISKNDSYSKSV